jgi:hypothetical protein
MTMKTSEQEHVAELHTQAAYAHTAAAFDHSTGDHASANELARKALKSSLAAARGSETVGKDPLLLT